MNIGPKSITAGRERGVVATEFVIILPLFLLFVFLVVEMGWVFKNYLVVTNASREVARCATVDRCVLNGVVITGVEPDDLMDIAVDRIRDGGAVYSHDVDDIQFSVYFVDSDNDNVPGVGESLIVCIDSPSRHITPITIFAGIVGAIPNPLHLKSRTEMRLEHELTGFPESSALCT